jgi:glutamate 5-kinase
MTGFQGTRWVTTTCSQRSRVAALARAIEDLVNAGKRILLVSTANVAVDNALHAVVKAMRPARGTVVRVGPPHLAEVANNPDVQLQQLAAAESNQVDEERLAIEQQLAGLRTPDLVR